MTKHEKISHIKNQIEEYNDAYHAITIICKKYEPNTFLSLARHELFCLVTNLRHELYNLLQKNPVTHNIPPEKQLPGFDSIRGEYKSSNWLTEYNINGLPLGEWLSQRKGEIND